VDAGRFRKDLFYRLNVFPILCPPLRDRREDVPELAEHLLRKHSVRFRKQIRAISPRSLDKLSAYDWPGNVRELENVIERAIILCSGPVLEVDEPFAGSPGASLGPAPRKGTLGELEDAAIRDALDACGWVVEGDRGAARRLGLEPSTLRSRMKKRGIRRASER
jgi:formate hydrogenlyase transcriptional activator